MENEHEVSRPLRLPDYPQRGHVDTENLGPLLTLLMNKQVNAIGLLGSTGAYAYFTRKERLRAIHASKEVIKDNIPLMVGIGALRTDEVCILAREAESAGHCGSAMP